MSSEQRHTCLEPIWDRTCQGMTFWTKPTWSVSHHDFFISKTPDTSKYLKLLQCLSQQIMQRICLDYFVKLLWEFVLYCLYPKISNVCKVFKYVVSFCNSIFLITLQQFSMVDHNHSLAQWKVFQKRLVSKLKCII